MVQPHHDWCINTPFSESCWHSSTNNIVELWQWINLQRNNYTTSRASLVTVILWCLYSKTQGVVPRMRCGHAMPFVSTHFVAWSIIITTWWLALSDFGSSIKSISLYSNSVVMCGCGTSDGAHGCVYCMVRMFGCAPSRHPSHQAVNDCEWCVTVCVPHPNHHQTLSCAVCSYTLHLANHNNTMPFRTPRPSPSHFFHDCPSFLHKVVFTKVGKRNRYFLKAHCSNCDSEEGRTHGMT